MANAHPLFRLLLAHPELLAEHASAYGEVLRNELRAAGAGWQRRAQLQALAAGAFLAATVLAGVLLMGWAALPDHFRPSMWAIPLLPAAVGAWACWAATRAGRPGAEPWAGLQRQLQADLALIRDTAPSS